MKLAASTVRKIQMQLTSVGLSPGPIDGDYGKLTTAAVKAFQRRAGLVVDGLAGPITRKALTVAVGNVSDPVNGIDRAPQSHDWPLQRDCTAYFGKVGTNQTTINVPYPLRIAWNKKQIVNRITCHEKVADPVVRVLTRVADHYGDGLSNLGLDLFGGCLNVRKMRGGNAWSMHSWGIALDFDPVRNQLKWGAGKAEMSKPIYVKWFDLWEEEGAISLGRERNYDWMHVQFARL